MVDSIIYKYGFELDNKKVDKEWLYFTQKNEERPLFIRDGLKFDLSEKDLIQLALFDEAQWKDFSVAGRNRDLLAALDNFLQQEKLATADIRGIATVVGVGGFTSTRIACVLANAFAYARKIPVVAVSKEQGADQAFLLSFFSKKSASAKAGQAAYISARYSGEPNIGRKK